MRLAPWRLARSRLTLRRSAPLEVGPAAEVSPGEVRNLLARVPPPIPFRDPVRPSPEQPHRLVTVHDFDLPAMTSPSAVVIMPELDERERCPTPRPPDPIGPLPRLG
jgi:hypothetical protein